MPWMSLAIALIPAVSITRSVPSTSLQQCLILPLHEIAFQHGVGTAGSILDLFCEWSMFYQRLTTTHILTASRSHAATRPEVTNSYHPGMNTPQSDGRRQIALRHQRCDQARTADVEPEP